MKNRIRSTPVIILTILLMGGLLVAINDSLKISVLAEEAPASVALVINEFMADNEAAVQDPFGTYPDWLELYNYGNTPVDINGMYLTDDLANPTWRFNQRVVIPPKGFLLIWADGQPGRGVLHTNFRILANGGVLGLFSSDRAILIDSITYDKQLRDVSYGRIPDGNSEWSYLTNSTAGEANIANPRSLTSTPWPIWIVIIFAVVACIGVLVRDKIRARKKK